MSRSKSLLQQSLKSALDETDWRQWEKLISGFDDAIQSKVEHAMGQAFGFGMSVGMDVVGRFVEQSEKPKASDDEAEPNG